MFKSIKLGRVAGIEIFLHPTFFLLLLMPSVVSGGPLGLLLLASVFGCVLLHELGHALAARRFGIETEDITLYPIGGVARLRRMPRDPGAELMIALAGPAVNVVLALGFGGLALLGTAGFGSLLGWFVIQLLVVNVCLAVFNLVPAFPMDGGRVLRALLSGWLGRLAATRLAAGLGRGLAVAFGVFSLVNEHWSWVALAVFVFIAAGLELARVEDEERPTDYDRHDNDGDGGLWAAPPGHRWVSRGEGAWQLAPIAVDQTGGRRRWR